MNWLLFLGIVIAVNVVWFLVALKRPSWRADLRDGAQRLDGDPPPPEGPQ